MLKWTLSLSNTTNQRMMAVRKSKLVKPVFLAILALTMFAFAGRLVGVEIMYWQRAEPFIEAQRMDLTPYGLGLMVLSAITAAYAVYEVIINEEA